MLFNHLVLAGGGHSHALILMRWAMKPHLKPKGLITLINRNSTTIYSGMFPGLLSGNYQLNEVLIDLRFLADKAGVSFIVGEINSLDLLQNKISVQGRNPPIGFSKISIDVGSDNRLSKEHLLLIKNNKFVLPVRPFEKSFKWIKTLDFDFRLNQSHSFNVIGSGLSAIEIAFALRERWPNRKLSLQAYPQKLNKRFKHALKIAKIEIAYPSKSFEGPALICTGSKAPKWLQDSGLQVNSSGRVLTNSFFNAIGSPNIFAVGDCGLIRKMPRPPSGVWAVRAAFPLARNIERSFSSKRLINWKPQPFAMQLVGGHVSLTGKQAWLLWGPFIIGPHNLIWKFKKHIDALFMSSFRQKAIMQSIDQTIACRGCAAKVAAQPLQAALKAAEIIHEDSFPEDASLVQSSPEGCYWFQSVDGFPALINDFWLNARITTLHACSDLWARGASVSSAQALITLPAIDQNLQEEILRQSLAGIKSALEPQGAKLLGGHTFESRSLVAAINPRDVEISLSINGFVEPSSVPWDKGGLKPGDKIVISRGLGSGVIFAAAMQGAVSAEIVDSALSQLSQSQHFGKNSFLSNASNSLLINACTDVTGFGLLGHLLEMIKTTNRNRSQSALPIIKIKLDASRIPSLYGAKELLREGYSSTFAPSNRNAWTDLNINGSSSQLIEFALENSNLGEIEMNIARELMVDPQTCGPLVVSCDSVTANQLVQKNSWHIIGYVDFV